MIRRTITLPDDLALAIEDAVAAGAARNVSRFLQQAARRHLEALGAEQMTTEARRLDPDEETAVARGVHEVEARPPWGRLA